MLNIDVGQEAAIDALIVTAVKEECDAVLSVDTGTVPGSNWQPGPAPTNLELFVRVFEAKGSTLRVAVTRAFGMGREQAVIAAAPLLGRHPEIRCLAMCGACAGRRGDVNLGDVIIADRTWPYDAGKLKALYDDKGDRTERLQGDIDLYRIHPARWKQLAERFQPDPKAPWIAERPLSYEMQAEWFLEQLAKDVDPVKHANRIMNCPDYGPVLRQLWKVKWVEDGQLTLTQRGQEHINRLMLLHPDGLSGPDPLKVVVGPIASGAPVVEDPTIFDRLANDAGMRKVVGLEMEISAILALAYSQRLPFAIVMKGVMDHADMFKSDNMKLFASKASAECLIAFLRENLPSSSDDPRPEGVITPHPDALRNAWHPAIDLKQRGPLTPCEFTVSLNYKEEGRARWENWGDVLVFLDNPATTDDVYLLPSRKAFQEFREPRFLKNPKTLFNKKQMTERFVEQIGGRRLQGFSFSKKMTANEIPRVHVYSAEYDEFLNASKAKPEQDRTGNVPVSGESAPDISNVTRLAWIPRTPVSGQASDIQAGGWEMGSSDEFPTVDFGIITALSEELDACLRQFTGVSKVTFEQSDTRTYYRGDIGTGENGSYQVVATVLPRTGNVEAALATNDLMHLWRPRYVLMVGIAGGVSSSKQALGDVVVSESILYYESAKIAQRVEPRPRVLQPDTLLYDRALNLRSEWYRAIPDDIQRPRGLNKLPALHFGPIASGEKVIADRHAVEYLRNLHSKLAAIEMEGAGVAAAAIGAVRRVGFLVIRGLSDFADAAKNDLWHEYAANSAAAFAFQLLKSAPITLRTQAVQQKEQQAISLQPTRIDRVALFRSIVKALDMEEFKTLCFLLGIDVDNIPGDRKDSKVRELILTFERRQRLDLVEKTFADMVQS